MCLWLASETCEGFSAEPPSAGGQPGDPFLHGPFVCWLHLIHSFIHSLPDTCSACVGTRAIVVSRSRSLQLKAWLCHPLAAWPQNSSPPLSDLGLSICKMGQQLILKGSCEDGGRCWLRGPNGGGILMGPGLASLGGIGIPWAGNGEFYSSRMGSEGACISGRLSLPSRLGGSRADADQAPPLLPSPSNEWPPRATTTAGAPGQVRWGGVGVRLLDPWEVTLGSQEWMGVSWG